MRLCKTLTLLAVLLLGASKAQAGAITVDDPLWYEFGFGLATSPVFTGVGTVPSSGGNSQYADDPAWTFTIGAEGGHLTVTDAFISGDQFEIFNNLVSLGLTSATISGSTCGSDPVFCLGAPNFSSAVINLAPGNYSITMNVVANAAGTTGGAAYFRVDSGVVPEPFTLGLVGTGIAGLIARRYRRSRK